MRLAKLSIVNLVDAYRFGVSPNKSLDASGVSGLVIDNLSVSWLSSAASTQTLYVAMSHIESCGYDDVTERNLFMLELVAPEDLPSSVNLNSKYFGAFIAWDARNQPTNVVVSLLEPLIEAGCRYFVCWGQIANAFMTSPTNVIPSTEQTLSS
jgi:hypothetical protein